MPLWPVPKASAMSSPETVCAVAKKATAVAASMVVAMSAAIHAQCPSSASRSSAS